MLVRLEASSPELAPYAAIRERDLVGRQGLFVAEGEVVVRVLAKSERRIRSLLLEERRVDALADVIATLDAPVYVVPQAVMDSVVGFAIHRGVLALGERGPQTPAADLVRAAKLVVVLIGLTNHDNVGGIFRNAAAFGADAVLLDDETCDPLYRKSIRVSAGAALLVPFARATSPIDVLLDAGIEPIALTPRGRETFASIEPGRYGVVLGTEGPGLPEAILARSRTVRIPMANGFDSLNVAVTSGIALERLATSRP